MKKEELQYEQTHKKWTIEKTTFYGRSKTTTIGGFAVLRSYRHISEYEREILKMRA